MSKKEVRTFYMSQMAQEALDELAKEMFPLRKHARSLTLETLVMAEIKRRKGDGWEPQEYTTGQKNS